ncbi:beta propeller repeat protein [Acidicapsa acidisoli]|uniref:hypothetical protein n=1 Tax=Acidicapsa acidisoli TaxID=1615681 RepID=UPI0021E09037|nr:hypothetical protein [Acidicapsa acidisoli]
MSQSLRWVMQDSGTTAGLRGIYSVDGRIAWASGTGGTVLRSTDGGEHWTKCAVPDADKDGAALDFRGVQAWDSQTAILMSSGPGDKSRLYKTVDGCKSWMLALRNENPDGFWDAIRMWTPTDGFLVGDPEADSDSDHPKTKFLYLSEFTSWNGIVDDSVFSESVEAKPGESSFAASNRCLAIGPFRNKDGEAREAWLATGGPSGSRVLHYSHFLGGEPERQASNEVELPMFPKTPSGGIFSLDLHGSLALVAVGGDYTKPNDSIGTAAYSLDGGLHWTAAAKPPHGYRSSVAWRDELKTWITVGTNGSDISRDDGKTWQPLDDGNWNAISLPFVVGPKGRIARLVVGLK